MTNINDVLTDSQIAAKRKELNDPFWLPNVELTTYGKMTSRPYQEVTIRAIIEHVKSTRAPAIVSASVGSGKTLIAAFLARHVSDRKGRVLVLSRQGEIIQQDADDAWLSNCKNSIYSASLGVKSTTYPVIFGTEGTVWKALETDLQYWGDTQSDKQPSEPSKLHDKAFDLLMIDEAHHVDFEASDSQYMKIISELLRRNPKMRIIGLTGTPYRGVTPIIGEADGYFWRKQLCDISTEYLTNMGYLSPIQWGFSHDDVGYDLSEFKSDGQDGTQDYTADQLRQMERKMLEAETTTQKIMIEIAEKTRDRNCVLITCAGKKHCKEAAKFLPEGSYKIITDDMAARTRRKALKDAYDGKVKFLLQIGCLSTGINIPLIDTIVILRKIGSLTLLTQLIGRGLRLLKDEQSDAGYKKENALVLDYSDTLNELKDLYDSPILDEADFSKSKENGDLITCPKCETENSFHAVRCRGVNSGGERCDFFWKSRICEDFYVNGKLKTEGCGAENAPTARQCRICENTLIDPNASLSKKHYTANDYKPVERFDMRPTKNNGVIVEYHLPNSETAKVFYSPFSNNQIAKRIFYNQFTKRHATTRALKGLVRAARNAGELCGLRDQLDTVEAVTHRTNDKDESVISKVINRNS